MKLLTLSPVLIGLALASCGRGERAALSNSAAPPEAARYTMQAKPASCVSLNTATGEELAQLPGVGEVIAQRIVDYRERHGPFRRPEEIIIIEGFSEKKYRAIKDLVCVD